MTKPITPRCAACDTQACRGGQDCFGEAERLRALYDDPRLAQLHRAASAIEARHYCKEPRIREVMLFAKELGVRKLGLAFCVGLASEADIVAQVFAREFEVVSVCCKACGVEKRNLELEQIDAANPEEVMCNPAGQALMLEEAGAELNVLVGLCVGHDAIFTLTSKTPTTTLIAKDRVLAHNPAGAIYSPYLRRTLLPKEE